jgi:hypothetical protein
LLRELLADKRLEGCQHLATPCPCARTRDTRGQAAESLKWSRKERVPVDDDSVAMSVLMNKRHVLCNVHDVV